MATENTSTNTVKLSLVNPSISRETINDQLNQLDALITIAARTEFGTFDEHLINSYMEVCEIQVGKLRKTIDACMESSL